MCELFKIFLLQSLIRQFVRERTLPIKHVKQYAWKHLIVTIGILLQSLILLHTSQTSLAIGGNSGIATVTISIACTLVAIVLIMIMIRFKIVVFGN